MRGSFLNLKFEIERNRSFMASSVGFKMTLPSLVTLHSSSYSY